jgi:hypothetical protein
MLEAMTTFCELVAGLLEIAISGVEVGVFMHASMHGP